MASRIYITGATGKLGKAVLEKTGAIPLVRRPSGLKDEIVTDFSLRDLSRIFEDADAILHIAGSVDMLNRKKLQESNVDLTRKVVSAAPGECRIVFAGSISVYGKKLKEVPADEETPVDPDSDYARSKYEAEKIVAKHPNHVILRIGTVYGPEAGIYFRILKKLEKGKMRMIGDGKNRVAFVHAMDVADVFSKSVSSGIGTYVIAGEPLSQAEVYNIAASELGVEAPDKRIGMGLAMLAAYVSELVYRLGGKRPGITREHVAILGYDRVFDCAKAKKELGFSPRSLEKGIMEMVRDYKKHKKDSW